MLKITVTREDAERLNRERWSFFVNADTYRDEGIRVILEFWSKDARATRRHDYRSAQCFDSRDTRNGSTVPPAIPQDVTDEARAKIIEMIDFSCVLERVEDMQERAARRRERLGY